MKIAGRNSACGAEIDFKLDSALVKVTYSKPLELGPVLIQGIWEITSVAGLFQAKGKSLEITE